MWNKTCKEIEQQICTEYSTNKITQKDLSKKYNISKKTIRLILERNGITKMKHGEYECKNIVNDKFFDKLNDTSAYWLGFIFGDGNIQKGNLRIMLSVNDLSHLENFKSDINSNHKLVIGKKNSSLSKTGVVDYCKIAISRASLVSSLNKYGLSENKTFRQVLPTLNDQLMCAFIRGYLDADGCVYVNNKRSNCRISFTGNEQFILAIKIYLDIKLEIKSSLVKKDIRNSYTFVISRGDAKIKLFNFLYDNSTRHLQRKYDKFKQIVSLYGDIQMKLDEPTNVGCVSYTDANGETLNEKDVDNTVPSSS